MKLRYILLLLLCFTLPALAKKKKIKPNLQVNGKSYLLTYKFSSTLSKETLMDIFFDYEHVIKYGEKTNLGISKVSENGNQNVLNYHYDYKVAELDITMERKKDYAANRVDFKMSKYVRSNWLIPIVTKSGGAYRITEHANGCSVVYENYTSMDKKIGWIYSKLIMKESKQFIEEILKYIAVEERRVIAKK